jgi:hypothetical protein
MSRRNSASRRRSYGRRLHEMNERRTRSAAVIDWLSEMDGAEPDSDGPASAARLPFEGSDLRDMREGAVG